MTRKKTLLALCMGLLVGACVAGVPGVVFANDGDKHDGDHKDHKKEGTHATQNHDENDKKGDHGHDHDHEGK